MKTKLFNVFRNGFLMAIFFLTFQNVQGQTQIEDPCYGNYPSLNLIGASPVCREEVWIYLKYSGLVNFSPANGNLLIDWDLPALDEFNYDGSALDRFAYIGDGVGFVITIRIPEVDPGTYTGIIKLRNVESCSSIDYSFSATLKEPLPKPDIEVISGSTEICDEGSVTFKAIGAVGAQYIWYQGGYRISTGQTFSKDFGTPGEPTNYYTYEVAQAYSDEIGNPLCESETASVTVTHSRKPYGGNIQFSDKMCTGSTKSVTWYQLPDAGGIYESSNTSVATVDQDGLVTAISAGTANISYVLTGTGACAGAKVTSTEQFDIYDNYAKITGNNSPVCDGDNAEFYIDAPENKILYYRWNDGEPFPIGTNQIIADKGILTAPGFTESITLTLVSIEYPNYCTKELNQSSTVFANPIPVTTISPTTSEIDEGGSVILTASGADEYYWIINTNLSSTTDATVTATPTINTIYKVRGTSNGCPSFDYATVYVRQLCTNSQDQYEPNNSMTANLFSIPIDLTISANLLNSKDPDWYAVNISSTAKYTLNYQYNNGTKLPSVDLYGSNGRRLKPVDRFNVNSYNLSPGWYYIKVYTGQKTYLCYSLQVVNSGPVNGALASVEDELKSAGIELSEDGKFSIWPNPARDEFRLYNGYDSPVRVRISDVMGRTMETIENVRSEETIVFGANYKPGLYFVETSGEEFRQVIKVIKQQ